MPYRPADGDGGTNRVPQWQCCLSQSFPGRGSLVKMALRADGMANHGSEHFTPSDLMLVRAAEGWVGLGDWKSAQEELEKITPELQVNPSVLKLRWEICAMGKQWDEGVEIGRLLVEAEPDASFGWINRSYALRRASGGGLQAAYDALKPAVDRLKDLQQVFFNLACYACQLDRLVEARQWWSKCFSVATRGGSTSRLKKAGLAEADLEPLWEEIKRASES